MDKLAEIYYNPTYGLRSAKSLYRKAKELSIPVTMKQTKEFIKNQKVNQVFRQTKQKYLPLYATSPFTRIQMDILDVRNEIPKYNDNVKYLLCVIDVFTRYGFVEPMKTRTENEVLTSFKRIIKNINVDYKTSPKQLDCDNEGAFISVMFNGYCESINLTMNYSEPEDFKSKGIVERWNRTLRELIARYRLAYETNRYIDVLPDIVEGYNNSTHSFLNDTPINAIEDSKLYQLAYNKRIDKYVPDKLSIGDKVRLRIKRKLFDKRSSNNIWTSTVHTIEEKAGVEYKVSNREGLYKLNDLLKVDKVETNPKTQSSFLSELQNRPIQNTERNIQQHRNLQRQRRILSREGLAN